MGLCWYCYWGWSRPVADIYLEAVNRLKGDDFPLLYSASHIVWEDENFHCADWCLENFEEYKGDFTDDELAVVRWSLEELLKLPASVKEIIPDGYDDWNPELYPPTVEVVKVR